MTRQSGLGVVASCLVISLVAGCGGGDAAGPGVDGSTSPSSVSSTTHRSGRYQPTPADFKAVARVLDRRARALRAHDLRGFLATVDRSNHALMLRQRTLFTNLTGLPLSELRYAMDQSSALVPARIKGHDPVLHPDITEFVQFAGSMDHPVTNSVHETFVRRGDRWVLGAEPVDAHGVQWRPWGGPPIASLRTADMTVIVDRTRVSTLSTLSQAVRSDIAFDASELGVPAAYQVVVDATSTGGATKFSSLSKQEAAAVTFPLVAGSQRSAEVGHRVAALAIKVNPNSAEELSQDTSLLRHELTHYLLWDYNGSSPIWLAEGIATWIQYYPDTFSALAIPPELYTRLTHADRSLPPVGLFNENPEVNYIVAQAAVAWLVTHYGMPRLLELMRAYRTRYQGANSDALTPRLLEQVYGVTPQQVVAGAFGLIAELRH
jgi:hypothetical protein